MVDHQLSNIPKSSISQRVNELRPLLPIKLSNRGLIWPDIRNPFLDPANRDRSLAQIEAQNSDSVEESVPSIRGIQTRGYNTIVKIRNEDDTEINNKLRCEPRVAITITLFWVKSQTA